MKKIIVATLVSAALCVAGLTVQTTKAAGEVKVTATATASAPATKPVTKG